MEKIMATLAGFEPARENPKRSLETIQVFRLNHSAKVPIDGIRKMKAGTTMQVNNYAKY